MDEDLAELRRFELSLTRREAIDAALAEAREWRPRCMAAEDKRDRIRGWLNEVKQQRDDLLDTENVRKAYIDELICDIRENELKASSVKALVLKMMEGLNRG